MLTAGIGTSDRSKVKRYRIHSNALRDWKHTISIAHSLPSLRDTSLGVRARVVRRLARCHLPPPAPLAAPVAVECSVLSATGASLVHAPTQPARTPAPLAAAL